MSNNTVFVIGNGPSLLDFNTSKLLEFPTIGCNSIHKLENFNPTYHCITDKSFFTFNENNIDKVFSSTSKFVISKTLDTFLTEKFNEDYLRYKNEQNKIYKIVDVRTDIKLNDKECTSILLDKDNFNKTYNARNTVIQLSIPLAVYLGFKRIILVGVDCNNEYTHFYDCDEKTQKEEDEKFEKLWTKTGFYDTPPFPRPLGYANDHKIFQTKQFEKINELAKKENIQIFNASNHKSLLNVFPRISDFY